MNDHGVFTEFAVLLIVSAVGGALAVLLKQPVLIAYIAVGILVGPSGMGWLEAYEPVALLSEIGVVVLLFVVGLKLDIRHVRHIGPVALATGLGQLTFTIVFGFLLTLLLGKGWIEAIYIAIALTFSSTIIIVKLLSDKREIDSLHGRIAVGFLIVQDLAVVLAMMGMSAFRGAEDASTTTVILDLGIRILGAALLLFVAMRYVLPRVVALMARSQELLLIFAIAWGTALAALGEHVGFSKEAGAFLAGFSLASTEYREAMNARLSSVRDFLLLFFFIALGGRLELASLGDELVASLILSAFVLIGNPLIVMAIMGWMGYRSRTGFLAGLTVAQISEFSIVFVAMGMSLGHVGTSALSLTTLVGLLTITLSTYMILYSHPLFDLLRKPLRVFERRVPHRELAVDGEGEPERTLDVVVVGAGRFGSSLRASLEAAGLRVLSLDMDPDVVRSSRASSQHVRYGDATDAELLSSLPLSEIQWVVTTLPDLASNRAVLRALREVEYRGSVAAVVRDPTQRSELQNEPGVTVVFDLLEDAASSAAERLARRTSTSPPSPI